MSKPPLKVPPTGPEIAALPPFPGLTLDQVRILRTSADFSDALAAIRQAGCIGFDTESKPTFVKGEVNTGPHVIQLSLEDCAYIIQVDADTPLDFLKDILESEAIIKAGFGLSSDRGPLFNKLDIRLNAAVDLSMALRHLRYKNQLGLKTAVAIVLGQKLQKAKWVTTSNWSVRELSREQLLYAANDAYASLKVYLAAGSPLPAPGKRKEKATP